MVRKSMAVLIGAFLLVGSAAPMFARNHEGKCEKRIRKAELKLEKAIRKHGEHSRQAEARRHDVEEARAHCH